MLKMISFHWSRLVLCTFARDISFFSFTQNMNVNLRLAVFQSLQLSTWKTDLRGQNTGHSLIWTAVSGRSVLRCGRQRFPAITWQTPATYSSWEPEHLRTRRITPDLTRCDSFSLQPFSTSLHSMLLNFKSFYFALRVDYCVQHFLRWGIHTHMRARTFLLEHTLFCLCICLYCVHVRVYFFFCKLSFTIIQ